MDAKETRERADAAFLAWCEDVAGRPPTPEIDASLVNYARHLVADRAALTDEVANLKTQLATALEQRRIALDMAAQAKRREDVQMQPYRDLLQRAEYALAEGSHVQTRLDLRDEISDFRDGKREGWRPSLETAFSVLTMNRIPADVVQFLSTYLTMAVRQVELRDEIDRLESMRTGK